MQRKSKTREIVLIGMFTAILAVLAQISIPLPSGVPATLQTFGIALCGAMLGWKLGAITILVYLLTGALGVPVFASMQGGLAILVGKTGGFLWGFLFMALLCGVAEKIKNKWLKLFVAMIGLIVDHIFGIIGFSILTNAGIRETFLLVSAPFLIKDIISVVGAIVVAQKLTAYTWKSIEC